MDDEYVSDEEEEYYVEEEDEIYEVVSAFKPEENGDLEIQIGDIVVILEKEESGWWKVEKENGDRGMVPSTFLRLYTEDQSDQQVITRRNVDEHDDKHENTTAKGRWEEIREGVHQPTTVNDVLSALGAFPSGFRPSMLQNLNSNSKYALKTAVLPSFTDSKISFQDLHWDPSLNRIRSQMTKILRNCTIQSCTMIPPLGGAIEVLSRQVRVCLFDGSKVLSNIHTVRCFAAANNPKLWKFARKNQVPLILQDYPSLTVRSNLSHANLGLLFELGVSYKRVQTNEKSEISCGWAHLKLSDTQGKPIPNKSYKLKLSGGTPYEQGLEVDSSILRRASTNSFQALLAANRIPKISVIIGTPAAAKLKYLHLLPETILVSSRLAHLVAIYRQILGENLLRDRLSHRDADLIPSPLLAAFPTAVEIPDLMDGFLSVWNERMKILKAPDKRDKENIKNMFTKCFMETVFPLLHSASLPEAEWGNVQIENQRKQKIFEHVTKHKPASALVEDPNFVLKSLLAPNVDHKPFDITEVCFDLIDTHEN